MILLLDPDRALLQRPHVLAEYPELDAAGPQTWPRGGVQLSKERCHEESILTSGVGDDDDVPLALLGGGQSHDLPVRLPLGDQQSVAAVDENADQVLGQSEMSICRVDSSGPITAHLGTRAEVLPADGDLGARRPLPRRDAAHYRGRAHGQSNIFLNHKYFLQEVGTSYGFFLMYRLGSEIRSLEDNNTKF